MDIVNFKLSGVEEENFNKPYKKIIGCLMYAMLRTLTNYVQS